MKLLAATSILSLKDETISISNKMRRMGLEIELYPFSWSLFSIELLSSLEAQQL